MVNKWVNEYTPVDVSHPGGTLKDLLDEKGMNQAQLAERTGRPKKTINEIIKGKTGITPETAIQLERVLSTPASFWINRQCQYDESVARKNSQEKLKDQLDWLEKIPVKEMVKAGWIPSFKDPTEMLNGVLTFFGVNSPHQWEVVWQNLEGVYRQSTAFEKSPEANSVWLRKGEIETEKIDCGFYDSTLFRQRLKEIRSLTRHDPEIFESRVVEGCAEAGVAVVFVPPLKGVPVYGVTRWITPEKALIQLSLRGRYEDILWFTFFHEAGHILKHGKKEVFVESEGFTNDKEKEADAFASDFLIPTGEWRRFIQSGKYRNKQAVLAFADELDISPAIIVGRLQHESLLPHSHMND
jgi:HTH-type transcriptional regulator/antitoxin HigA